MARGKDSYVSSRTAAQFRARRIIVEIGCGEVPFPLAAHHRQISSDEFYIGVDRRPQIRNASNFLSSLVRGRSALLQADGLALPLSNESVDEVVLCNVLGDRATLAVNPGMLTEVERVLKLAGEVTVVETYTADAYPVTKLRREMSARNLLQSNRGHEVDLDGVSQYADVTSGEPGTLRYEAAKERGDFYIAKFTKYGPVRRNRS